MKLLTCQKLKFHQMRLRCRSPLVVSVLNIIIISSRIIIVRLHYIDKFKINNNNNNQWKTLIAADGDPQRGRKFWLVTCIVNLYDVVGRDESVTRGGKCPSRPTYKIIIIIMQVFLNFTITRLDYSATLQTYYYTMIIMIMFKSHIMHAGELGNVTKLRRSFASTAVMYFWLPPFTLNVTNAEPDITYCVKVYNITCPEGESINQVDTCSVTQPNFALPKNFLPSDTYEIEVTPRTNLAIGMNGTKSTYRGAQKLKFLCIFSVIKLKIMQCNNNIILYSKLQINLSSSMQVQ